MNSLQSLSLEIGIEGSIVTYKRRLARSLCISSLRTATVYGRPPLGLPQIAETWPYSPKYLIASPTESSGSFSFKTCCWKTTPAAGRPRLGSAALAAAPLLGAGGCCSELGAALAALEDHALSGSLLWLLLRLVPRLLRPRLSPRLLGLLPRQLRLLLRPRLLRLLPRLRRLLLRLSPRLLRLLLWLLPRLLARNRRGLGIRLR